jgi:hypothetical protein
MTFGSLQQNQQLHLNVRSFALVLNTPGSLITADN